MKITSRLPSNSVTPVVCVLFNDDGAAIPIACVSGTLAIPRDFNANRLIIGRSYHEVYELATQHGLFEQRQVVPRQKQPADRTPPTLMSVLLMAGLDPKHRNAVVSVDIRNDDLGTVALVEYFEQPSVKDANGVILTNKVALRLP